MDDRVFSPPMQPAILFSFVSWGSACISESIQSIVFKLRSCVKHAYLSTLVLTMCQSRRPKQPNFNVTISEYPPSWVCHSEFQKGQQLQKVVPKSGKYQNTTKAKNNQIIHVTELVSIFSSFRKSMYFNKRLLIDGAPKPVLSLFLDYLSVNKQRQRGKVVLFY